MTKFQEAYISEEEITKMKEALVVCNMIAKEDAERIVIEEAKGKYYKNDTYQVRITNEGSFIHLSIKRLDREPIHDWRDLQTIKNELVGADCEAVELYPAESRLVDTSNQYHLYAVKDPYYRFPFGYTDRLVTDKTVGKSKQRKF